jgi:hypothetical protein
MLGDHDPIIVIPVEPELSVGDQGTAVVVLDSSASGGEIIQLIIAIYPTEVEITKETIDLQVIEQPTVANSPTVVFNYTAPSKKAILSFSSRRVGGGKAAGALYAVVVR